MCSYIVVPYAIIFHKNLIREIMGEYEGRMNVVYMRDECSLIVVAGSGETSACRHRQPPSGRDRQ